MKYKCSFNALIMPCNALYDLMNCKHSYNALEYIFTPLESILH